MPTLVLLDAKSDNSYRILENVLLVSERQHETALQTVIVCLGTIQYKVREGDSITATKHKYKSLQYAPNHWQQQSINDGLKCYHQRTRSDHHQVPSSVPPLSRKLKNRKA